MEGDCILSQTLSLQGRSVLATVLHTPADNYDVQQRQTLRKSGAQSYGTNGNTSPGRPGRRNVARTFRDRFNALHPGFRQPVLEIVMSCPETRLFAATAIAVLAFAGWGAYAADPRGVQQVALAAPISFTPLVTTSKPVTVMARKKPKPEKKAKILTGLQSFRMPAQQALDRLSRPASPCQSVGIVCPAVFHDGSAKSQSWQYATGPSSSESESEQSIADMSASGEPALVRPFTDVPGFVPGRETIYRFSLNVPVGRDEHVQLQANVRRNAYNTEDSSDSTLRADWSLRF